MLPDDPRHGQERGYYAHVRAGELPCDPCRRGHTRAENMRRLDHMAGRPRWLPAHGSRRRIQALMALGWTQAEIAIEAGYSTREGIKSVLWRDMIQRPTADRIVRAYDELSMRIPAPTPIRTRIRNAAAKNGWAPPLAWDDIDDPNEQPNIDGPTVTRPNGRPMKRDKVIENAEWMADADENLTVVCERLGLDPEALYQACRRGNRLDLYAKLSRRQPDGAGEQAAAMRGLRGAA